METVSTTPAMDLNNLYYREGEKYLPLPEWVQFFLVAGTALEKSRNPNRRLIAGFAVPTRDYAAVFLAAGIVTCSVRDPKLDERIQTYFQKLCSLRIGTPLVYRQGSRKLKAVFMGVEQQDKVSMLKLRIESGDGKRGRNLTKFIPPELAMSVDIASRPFTSLPKRQKGRSIHAQIEFLSLLLGKNDAADFVSQSQLKCLLIGSVESLAAELTKTPLFATRKDGTLIEGTLQEILRARQLLPQDGAYRSELYSARNPTGSCKSVDFAIFDGANGFLKWRDTWRNSNWIVILDRTEPTFHEAADLLNQEYIKNGSTTADLAGIPAIPAGVELMVYVEE